MEHIHNSDEKLYMLTAKAEQAEIVAAAAQAKSLLPGVKLLVPEAFKGSMDGIAILNFIY